MIFRQLIDKESSTYTYLLADHDSNEAVLIDPVREQFQRDISCSRSSDSPFGIRLKHTCMPIMSRHRVSFAKSWAQSQGVNQRRSRLCQPTCPIWR